jgi:putative solute:sodium symporter small subunit
MGLLSRRGFRQNPSKHGPHSVLANSGPLDEGIGPQGGASVSEQPGRDRHRRRTLILVILTILVVLGGITAVVASAGLLDRFGFLRIPLGFYLLAQGLLVVVVAISFWAAIRQERIDRAYSEGEEA